MADNDLDVRAKLVVDDASTSELKRIAQGHEQVGEEAKQSNQQVGFLQHTMANFAAIQLSGLIENVRQFGASFVEAASAGQDADQAIAGMISAVQGSDWASAHAQAEALGDELDEIAISAGQAGDDVGRAFNRMVEIYGATADGIAKAKEDTGSLATIANVLGKQTETIAGEFALMGEGVVKTKSQMFQLLQPTGIFGDNIKKASQLWASLTEEERARRLNFGIEQLAGQMGKANPTFHDMLTTVENIWDVTKEKLGEPVIHALVPAMQKFAATLESNLPAIEEFGKMMAVDVKAWVDEASTALQEGFQYLESHGDEIRGAIVDAVSMVKEVVSFILAHKEELAIAFGAKSALGLAGGVANAIGGTGVPGMIGKGVGALYSAGAGGAEVFGRSATGLAGGGFAVGAGLLAVTSILAAAEQAYRLQAESAADTRNDFVAIKEGMERMAATSTEWTEQEVRAFEVMRANLLDAAVALGEDVGAAAQYATALEEQTKAHVRNAEAMRDFQQIANDIQAAQDAGIESFDAATGAFVAAADSEAAMQAAQQFAQAFTAAQTTHDQSSMNYLAHILSGSKALTSAFLSSASLTDQGWAALADSIEAGGSQFADIAKMFRDQIGGAQVNKKLEMKQNFNFGAGSVSVKQDFRNENPDNIALIFKRDLAGGANRLAANVGFR